MMGGDKLNQLAFLLETLQRLQLATDTEISERRRLELEQASALLVEYIDELAGALS